MTAPATSCVLPWVAFPPPIASDYSQTLDQQTNKTRPMRPALLMTSVGPGFDGSAERQVSHRNQPCGGPVRVERQAGRAGGYLSGIRAVRDGYPSRFDCGNRPGVRSLA